METVNDQYVGLRGEEIVVLKPKQKMTREEALRHAAWLVAIAEDSDGEFETILKEVKKT